MDKDKLEKVKKVKELKIVKEFRDFITRGNVIDLAVAVVIGGAFNKIVTSLVNDIIMPCISLVIGSGDFNEWKVTLKGVEYSGDKVVHQAIVINLGSFVQNIIDFLLIAFSIFIVIKAFSKLQHKIGRHIGLTGEKPAAKLTKDQELLSEIRDVLKGQAKAE